MDCGEKLLPISSSLFSLYDPHPYVALSAPYGSASPWMLREGVLKALEQAQECLATLHSGYKFKLFDAYRPNQVQDFMVKRQFIIEAQAADIDPVNLTRDEYNRLAERVFGLFAAPSNDPMTPPPHSTGGALDLTIMDEDGHELDMGTPIDVLDGAAPNYFANAADAAGQHAHTNRTLLDEAMRSAGFYRNPREWWHFSLGDQSALWLEQQENPADCPTPVARYGRADLLG